MGLIRQLAELRADISVRVEGLGHLGHLDSCLSGLRSRRKSLETMENGSKTVGFRAQRPRKAGALRLLGRRDLTDGGRQVAARGRGAQGAHVLGGRRQRGASELDLKLSKGHFERI